MITQQQLDDIANGKTVSFFENPSIYGPTDPVGHLHLEVDCHPSAASGIAVWLSYVAQTAGVYVARINREKDSGKQPIQQPDPNHRGEPQWGQRRETAEGKPAAVEPKHEPAKVAGPTGEKRTGPLSGRS